MKVNKNIEIEKIVLLQGNYSGRRISVDYKMTNNDKDPIVERLVIIGNETSCGLNYLSGIDTFFSYIDYFHLDEIYFKDFLKFLLKELNENSIKYAGFSAMQGVPILILSTYESSFHKHENKINYIKPYIINQESYNKFYLNKNSTRKINTILLNVDELINEIEKTKEDNEKN